MNLKNILISKKKKKKAKQKTIYKLYNSIYLKFNI